MLLAVLLAGGSSRAMLASARLSCLQMISYRDGGTFSKQVSTLHRRSEREAPPLRPLAVLGLGMGGDRPLSTCVLILLKTWRYISRLLIFTYLLTCLASLRTFSLLFSFYTYLVFFDWKKVKVIFLFWSYFVSL